jgi:redox-sensitive bicupin YhaK (pirin superfamily)
LKAAELAILSLGDKVELSAKQAARIILLAGKPIGKLIVRSSHS